MPRITKLWRYPVKGFTAEPLESLRVQDDGRIAGDRVLAFRFANAATPRTQDGLDYWPKSQGLALQDFPSLAALRLTYDDASLRVKISTSHGVLVEAGLDTVGRKDLCEAVADFVLAGPEGRRLNHPSRLPLVLVGDGKRAAFQDRARGYVTIHSAESVTALGDTMDTVVDSRRFRSNIECAGGSAWAELDWASFVDIGEVRFVPEGNIIRCLATHADPDTGVRDLDVLQNLTHGIGQPEPTLGRLLLPWDTGGVIRVGDAIVAHSRAHLVPSR